MKDSKAYSTKDKDLQHTNNVSKPTNEKVNNNFYNLTTPQKNIWDMEQFYSNTPLNNVCGSVIIHEKVDFDRLKIAVDVMVRMNDAFGIELVNDNDTVKQLYNKNIVSNFSSEIVEVADKNELNDLENKLSHIVFSKNNLFDLKVFKLPNNEGGVISAVHHTLADSWAQGLICKYIIDVYYDLLQMDVLPVNIDDFVNDEKKKYKIASYFDFVQKENDYLNSSSFTKDKKYWNDMFATVPDIPEFLPTVNDNSNLPTASRESFVLNADILKKINEFCTDNNTSVYNFLIAVYSTYISSITNSNDFVIGTPVLNRRTVAEKSTIGMFVSTMPLRVNVNSDISFNDFCRQLSANTFSAFRHQHYPYEKIVGDLRKEHKNLSNLYNVLISYQITKTISDKVNCETYWTFNGYSSDDLQIHILDLNDTGKLCINYDYKNNKYAQNDIKDLHCRILNIIDTVLNDYKICIKDIDIVTPIEKNRILNDFNNTFKEYDKNKTFAILFEEQVKRTPNNIALIFGTQKLTYKELNERANSLAKYLRNQGVKRNDLVGIMVNRSLEVLISILAVLKSGGAYIPIDPHFPEDRVLYMLENSNAKLLLTQKVLENSSNYDNKIFVDLDNNEIYDLPSDNLKCINKPDDLAYVVFTSGSTGNPKGVMVKHSSLSNFTNYCNEHINFIKNSKNMALVTITTISFDMFVLDLVPIQNGVTIVMANEDEQNTPYLLNELIEKNNVNVIQSTPSRIQTFINNIEDIPSFKKLNYFELGGEQVPLSLVKTLQSFGADVYNCYGPTETTVYSSIIKLGDSYITAGKPMYNTQIYFLNNNLKLMPIGVPGELYISGDGVSKGYINNKELTDKSFIPSPYFKNKIMYKTGDLGFYTKDGHIICLGRADYQVKIRGQRIELGEIEEQISSLSSIKTCVVVKKVDSNSHEFLCAYFTAIEDIDINEVRNYLSKHLPKYMIPQFYMQMESLPYTPNGKVDRKALPEIKAQIEKTKKIAPRNDIDAKLVDVFKDLLHIDKISINDSFFDLGGDSLSAINLCTRIQSKFNAQLSVRDILDNPVLQDLSDVISNSMDLGSSKADTNNSSNYLKIVRDNSTNTIKKVPKADFYATSAAQKRMFLVSQVAGNSTLYNVPGCIVLNGKIDAKKVKKCINMLIERHETLRTYFEVYDENIIQKVLDKVDFKLNVSNNAEFDNLQAIFEEFDTPFNLSVAPLFKAKLVNFKNGKSALLLDAHHIICDGTSISIFADEVCKLYNGESLPELSITYKDYANFENDRLLSGALDEAKSYWLSKFINEVPILNMPTNYTRPSIQSFEGDRKYLTINAETVEKINNLSKKLHITPYILMLSAYYIMLSKYTNQDDIVVGSPVASRDVESIQNLIGMFVNTLALRNNVNVKSSIKDFMLSLKNNVLDSLKYQTYPFNELVNDLNLKRDNSRSPLFDVFFVYQNYGFKNFNFGKITSKYFIPNTHISKFDLSLEVLPIDNEMKLTFEYATSLFTKDFIADLSKHYLSILNTILDDCDTKIADICILSEEEKNKILYDFNNTKVDYDSAKTLSVMFEEQVRKTPNNIALVFEDKELTFKELNEKANSLAYYLRSQKIGRDDIVGVMCNRSLEMVISILAVIKSGAAYTPIDPTYPEDRINYMLDTINAKLLLTQKILENKVEFKDKLFVDLDNNDIYTLSNKNLKNINKPDDLFYVIFTSGSTGRPKGVMMMHKALSNFANYCNNYVEYLKNPKYRAFLSITTVSFDLFVYEVFISLQKGIKIVLANEDEKTSPSLLNKLIEKYNVTILQSTPSIIQTFINNIDDMPLLKNIEFLTMAGEQLPISLVHKLHNLSNVTIYNGYGPSETNYVTLYKMDDELITIGKPFYNTQMYILNKNLSPVPIGSIGEIYISGEGVARGYIHNDELTKKSFIENPFVPKAVMYKTGDLGSYLPDGRIICSGRVDHQVKIRGQRVELGEIEEQIFTLPSIKTCVVTKKIDENSHEFLCAYFTADEDVNISNIKKHLEAHLPRYMIPQYYMQLPELPYTPNGKIDRKALPMPTLEHSEEDIVLPQTETEIRLLELFKEILHIDIISVNDSFFDIGGDSLSAINLSARIQSEFNVQLFVRDILDNSSIRELAKLIDNSIQKTDKNSDDSSINSKNNMVITPVQKSDYYKVSSAQKRIYFASQVDSSSIVYNISGGVILDGKLDIDKLKDAFKVVVDRHEVLRTYFELQGAEVVQKVADNIDFNLNMQQNANFDELDNIFNDFVKPFDLSNAPLFRAKLVTFTNGQSALLIDTHHIICDGTSITIFVDELCKLYNGATLPELNITYKDFANYENEKISSGVLDDAEKYWLDKFKGEIPVLNMPTIYTRPATQSFEGKKVYSIIDANTTSKINTISKELHITPYMLMLGTFYILLSKYTSQNDIIIGSPVASRDISSTYNLIGMFVNTLALREKVDNSLPFRSFILALKDDLLNAYKYQTYPFDELTSKLDVKRDLARNPLFDFMFIYQNAGFKSFDFDGVSSKYYVPDNHTSKYDLTLEAVPEDGSIKLNFEYSSKLFNKDFIKSFASHYLNILNTILDNVDIQISNISILSEDEQSTLLDELNDTSLDYPKEKCIIDLFEEQAKKTPNNVALVFGNETYTYKELEEKINLLSSYIKKLSIFKKIAKDPLRAIGIMMNRRAEVLISMLAILKSGCGYLPIDPTYPEDRVSYIIDNSNIKLILTEKSLASKFVNPRSKSTKFDGFAIDTVIVDDENIYTIDSENTAKLNKVSNKALSTDINISMLPSDLAYLIYTSGSTGNPKGVMIRQNNVVNFIYAMRKLLPLKNKSIVSITTMCFDIFVLESLLPLCSGVKVVLASNDEQNSPILLNELCKKNKVDIIQTTPSKFNFLISDESNLDYVKNMKVILLGGEPFPLNLLNKLKKLTDARIFNMYGPTETTVWSTVKELTDSKNITIGTPIANTQTYVLDNDLNVLPKNVPGKLFIGGDGVTDGYLNRQELTYEKFVDFRGAKIYDTGDLAKINSAGELECLGRTDFQVKIRGLRIELGEIEKQIASYQGVTEAVVVVKNINGRDVLCGYFVSAGRVTISQLRSKLSKKLPTYMVPTYFVQLQSFEHTPNGKIDRKKLPDPHITKKDLVSPKTALQRRILLIWKSILSIDEISIDDNFFEIGGDSLCALKLQLELMKININVEYGDIFKNNTIENLAEFIESMSDKKIEGPIYHSYNFLKANMVLWRNNDKFNLKLEQKEIKNVLLVGATGYLGIHVLAELLKIDNIKIYCLIRNDPSTSAENKLKNKFKYYFGSDLSNLFGNRIIVVPGEITEEYFGLSDTMYKTIASSVYTVVNCAALVKHFGKYEDFERINVTGVKNIVTFCEKYGKTLFHTSTISVAGNGLMGLSSGFNPTKIINYGENRLYVKQCLNNVYVRSKFEAEKFILEELANKKLRGIILRIGNVTNRFVDGKFQENASENAFHNRLKAFKYLKMIPKSIYDGYVEFSPVDSIAQSIIQTMKFYTQPMSVLHLFNSKHLYIKDLLVMLRELGIKIDVVEDDIFKDNLKNILFNSPNYDKVSVLLNDIDSDFNLLYKTNLIITNKFTLKFLNIAGFDWPEITKEYIKKVIDNL